MKETPLTPNVSVNPIIATSQEQESLLKAVVPGHVPVKLQETLVSTNPSASKYAEEGDLKLPEQKELISTNDKTLEMIAEAPIPSINEQAIHDDINESLQERAEHAASTNDVFNLEQIKEEVAQEDPASKPPFPDYNPPQPPAAA